MKRLLLASALGWLLASTAVAQTSGPSAPTTPSASPTVPAPNAPIVSGTVLPGSGVFSSGSARVMRRGLFGRLRNRTVVSYPMITTTPATTVPMTVTPGTVISTPGTGGTLPGTLPGTIVPKTMPSSPTPPTAPAPKPAGQSVSPSAAPAAGGGPAVVTVGGTPTGGMATPSGGVATAGGVVPPVGRVVPAGSAMSTANAPGTVLTPNRVPGPERVVISPSRPVLTTTMRTVSPTRIVTATAPTTGLRVGWLGRIRARR